MNKSLAKPDVRSCILTSTTYNAKFCVMHT
jgi:hypothetical protein